MARKVPKAVPDQGRSVVYAVIVNNFDGVIGWRCVDTVRTTGDAGALLATYGARGYAAHYEKVRYW